jgi:hypothetical protein
MSIKVDELIDLIDRLGIGKRQQVGTLLDALDAEEEGEDEEDDEE